MSDLKLAEMCECPVCGHEAFALRLRDDSPLRWICFALDCDWKEVIEPAENPTTL